MTTKRTPLARAAKDKITPEMVDLFKRMRRLEYGCTCPPINWNGKYWEHSNGECASCTKWWKLHSLLWRSMNLHPGDWPAIANPEAESPYPPGSHAAEYNKPDPDATRRYRILAKAADITIETEYRDAKEVTDG